MRPPAPTTPSRPTGSTPASTPSSSRRPWRPVACSIIGRPASAPATRVTQALRTRTFYVVPRVNPDGAEWVLADRAPVPSVERAPWPWRDGHRWPGLHVRGRRRRRSDPPDADRPTPTAAGCRTPTTPGCWSRCRRRGARPPACSTYRSLIEGTVADHDGFTIGTPRPVEGLDLNRNFPAGWGPGVTGSGDHPLSEPEIDALVRAIVARPNICGYNAYPHQRRRAAPAVVDDARRSVAASRRVDLEATRRAVHGAHRLPVALGLRGLHLGSQRHDEWRIRRLGLRAPRRVRRGPPSSGTSCTPRRAPSSRPTSGTSDPPTTRRSPCCGGATSITPTVSSTGTRSTTHSSGRSRSAAGTTCRPGPTRHRTCSRDEVAPHADFAVHQALCRAVLEVPPCRVRTDSVPTPGGSRRASPTPAGCRPTSPPGPARSISCYPLVAELTGDGVEVVGGPARQQLGQLEGRSALRFRDGNDGTPDRALRSWVVRGTEGATATVEFRSARAGRAATTVELA